ALDTHGNPIDWADGDFNYDGTVNFADLLLVAQNFNKTLSSSQLSQLPGSFQAAWALAEADVAAAQTNNVPEPTGGILLMSALAAGLTRRRRRAC
ncbi:MAG: PEP-CTERM sorting domain-containing protein, partial [Tepidisphaeraceae bacterium]